MVDPSFDAEYPSYPGLVDPKNVNFRFYRRKTGWKPDFDENDLKYALMKGDS